MKSPDYFEFETDRERSDFNPEENNNIIEIEGPILKLGGNGSYKLKGFDINHELKNVKGPIIEVAGPTEDGFKFVDMKKLPKEIFISNLYPGAPQFDPSTGKLSNYYGRVDFQADGQNLPLKDGSAGAIFIKCLGVTRQPDGSLPDSVTDNELKQRIITEAGRALEEGGVFVLEEVQKEFFEHARNAGFELKQYKISEGWGSFIFEKEKMDDESDKDYVGSRTSDS